MTHATARVHGGSVSAVVAPLVRGPFRRARVVAVTRYAVHLATGDAELPALAVVTRDAIRLPNACVVPFSSVEQPLDVLTSAGGSAGARRAGFGVGRIVVGSLGVEPGASWTPPRVQGASSPPDPELVERAGALLDSWAQPVPPALVTGLADLRAALAEGRERVGPAAHALVGLGPGLTPSGDDVLCGALLASRVWGGPLGALSDAVADAARRTPLLSAALLRHAVRGECVAQAREFLRALCGEGSLDDAARGLLAVGHHSGGDLARGVLAVGGRARAYGAVR
ncbi:DUF2877 domain-containing protein [Streptomyces sp. NPDC046821]|uniref:DUF2877 domain-containing protein n=1 Tax=Streptomyces sp. NPDC046821 TaxID=3154702 RepID=UPI0033D0AC52